MRSTLKEQQSLVGFSDSAFARLTQEDGKQGGEAMAGKEAAAWMSARNEFEDERGAAARIENEVSRDPNRADTKIARAANSSAAAVRRVRDRLGIYPTGPS
jgi:hypothetical protein